MEEKNNFTLFNLLKKIKLRTVIILIILLVFNSYAWFIYSTKVAVGLEAHVSSWDVSIEAGEGETTGLQIVVDRIYPGMETFEKTIEVHNRGEVSALLSYEVKAYTILGQSYTTSDDETNPITEEDLKNHLENDYPFKVSVKIPETTIGANDGYGSFTVTVEWPFESGDDAADTHWGEESYKYYSLHPDTPSLSVDLLLSVEQGT